jgi:hypothetical protein
MDKVLPLLNVKTPEWGKALQVIREDDETSALAVDPPTGKTALHCAAAAGATGVHETKQRRTVIETLLRRHPEVTSLRCQEKGYTPLAYAVHTIDIDVIDEDAEVVKALLNANPAAMRLKTDTFGALSPISLHIHSVSHLQQHFPSFASTSVLQVLISHSDLSQLEHALETIYACNTVSIMERFTKEEQLHVNNVRQFGRHATREPDGLVDFWVWDWVLCILKGIHQKRNSQRSVLQSIPKGKKGSTSNATMPVRAVSKKTPPFHALHTMSQITDCPIPFLLMAIRAYPSQVRVADPHNGNNLPLHAVASWQPKQSSCRKSMILTSLVAVYPRAVHAKNKYGKNPVELEAASGSVIE